MSRTNTRSTRAAPTPNSADLRRFFRLTFLLFALAAILFVVDRANGPSFSDATSVETPQAVQAKVDDPTDSILNRPLAADPDLASAAHHPFRPEESSLQPKAGVGDRAAEHTVGPTIISEPLSATSSNQTTDSSEVTNTGSTPRSWGLDRIDQRGALPDGSFQPAGNGDGVDIYIFDTGIRKTHAELGNRVVGGASFVPDEPDPFNDCGNHGTKVASAAAGHTVGVAPAANLYSVKTVACNRQGYIAWVTEGVEWVLANHSGPSVVNFSFGTARTDGSAYDALVSRLTSAGIVVVASAGNGGIDACRYQPASSPDAITVGAVDRNDVVPAYTNTGSCVDIFAPGSNNLVASADHDEAFDLSQTGTSFAAPYVAGAAAIYLAQNPDATPAMVRFHLLQSWATTDVLTGTEGSPNRLLFIGEN